MQEMGVPKHIQEDVLGTPSERALVLDDKTVKTYFWLELPYRHEWKKNRCSKLSESETQRTEDYSRRLLRARSAAAAGLSKAEWNDLTALQKKQNEESRCDIEIEKQSRTEAYARYFGVKPTDYAEHNFSKWSDSARYLGRRFYELQAEERFDEEKLEFDGHSLTRPATSNAPDISILDSPSKPRVVSKVRLVGVLNPSPEFIQRLVMSLEGAWGRRSGGNSTTEWLWDKKGFSARLTHFDPIPAEQSFLGLTIESK
jgi:hypothetical protein